MEKVFKTSNMVKKMKPVWAGFIISLGYTKRQGKAFAEGYAAGVAKLPILGKLKALENQDDRCMKVGFKASGINEEEALKRFNSKQHRSI
ncbi:MAG: hypothetical protein Q7S73_02940 [bacterium]|nr:hypothetical protein [bacterium]